LPDLENVKVATTDMAWPLINGLRAVLGDQLPIVIDKRHVLKDLKQSLIDVYVSEIKEIRQSENEKRLNRFVLCRPFFSLEATARAQIGRWCQQSVRLEHAYLLFHEFNKIYTEAANSAEMKAHLDFWSASVHRLRLQKAYAKTLGQLRDFGDMITAYPDFGVTNAGCEAMVRSIKALLRRGGSNMHDDLILERCRAQLGVARRVRDGRLRAPGNAPSKPAWQLPAGFPHIADRPLSVANMRPGSADIAARTARKPPANDNAPGQGRLL
jgi:hypothetical protein